MSERSMRFCLVTTFYPPFNFGGDGIQVQRLAVELASRGHHVEVVHCVDAFDAVRPSTEPVAPEYDDHPAIIHHRLQSRAGVLSPLVTQQLGHPGFKSHALRRILSDSEFDVVHFHNISLIGPMALRLSRALTLYTMHEHWLVCPMHVLWRFDREPCTGRKCIRCQLHGGRPPQLWRYTPLLQRTLRYIDAFIAPSQFTRAKHLEMGLQVTAPIVHIPNFLPLPRPASIPDTPPHARPYFLFVGRLERIKGAQVAIEAFTRYTKADLLIAGAGSEAETLHAQAAGQTHIHFLGKVPYRQVEVLMRHAIAVVVPSVGFETFGNIVAEANAHGTPVIGHRLGPLPEMIDGCGGLTYSSMSELLGALEQLQSDPALRARLGQRGYEQYLAHWSPERHLDQYFDLITNGA